MENLFPKTHQVFLVYCSSDAHAGNRSAGTLAGAGTSRWHFRGKDIVASVVSDLAKHDNLASASTFLLTGGSGELTSHSALTA